MKKGENSPFFNFLNGGVNTMTKKITNYKYDIETPDGKKKESLAKVIANL